MLNQLLSKTMRMFGIGILLVGLAGCDIFPDGDGGNDSENSKRIDIASEE